MLQTRSSILLVAQVNTQAGGSAVVITNSGGLYAMQSGTWTVGISNSAGWVVNVANTGGSVVVSNTQTAINIINSAGWVFAQSNTAGMTVTIINSSNINIANSSGWIVSVANTGGIVAVSNTQTAINIINSSGWIMTTTSQSLRPKVASMTTVVSTIGLVTLLTNNATRVGATFYNDSIQPLYLKLGASASTASFTLKITSSGYYEVPSPTYTGIITGLWGSAIGTLYISEMT